MPDVMAPEAHQNDRSYLSELSGPTFDFNMHKFYGGWLNVGPKKPTKLSKLSSECLRGDGCLPRTIRYIYILYQMYRAMYASNTGARGHMLPQVFSLFHIYPVLQMKFTYCVPPESKSLSYASGWIWLCLVTLSSILGIFIQGYSSVLQQSRANIEPLRQESRLTSKVNTGHIQPLWICARKTCDNFPYLYILLGLRL